MEKHKTRHVFIEHIFEYRSARKRKLILSLLVTLVVMIIEFAGGFITNSIALISDAVHMLTHSLALLIGLAAIFIAKHNPPCHHKTFGLYRAEILAAFINGFFLLIFAGTLIYQSILRFIHPREILSTQMFIIAFIGLGANVVSILILGGSHGKDINIKGIFYHMISDAVSSVGILAAAVIILFTRWNFLDPLVSIGICILIVYWSAGVLKESTQVLLEMVPTGLNIDTIKNDIEANFQEVKNIFHIHIWTITSDILALSCYIQLHDSNKLVSQQDAITSKIRTYLYKKYNIIESTIQITEEDESVTCAIR